MIEGEFISLATKTLLVVIIITISISAIVFYYREYQVQRQTNQIGKEGLVDFKKGGNAGINYIMWIGDIASTLDVLALAQQGATIQPIYIPDPQSSAARNEYELQVTRTLRVQINTKYPQSQILPIISITRERPDDDAFNREYDFGADDGASDAHTRDNILRRWSKYYKLPVTTLHSPSTGSNRKSGIKQLGKNGNGRILAETWNCRFPIAANQIPCGLCKKCEKLNAL
jgi:hypothetical protein